MIEHEKLVERKNKLVKDRIALAERLQALRSEEQTIIQNLSAMNGAIQVLDEFIVSSNTSAIETE